ncbi:hypothetical protein SAMN05216503_0533 [Polaribacter sp. KT25b]|uniref:hypothetical protein n=1 Tax=Polaribacter sp. KT25b TaxID=1855336 RepID=UPI00087C8C4C|nr:hypothetical protein [Polaribacter sp. KT25b]SDR70724.1 hypothetical protein SAMN05216503_0533 [Polaribacter sp. KT25b]
MKKIIKFIAVFAMIFALTSCEEESNFKESEIALTPVYSITDITGTNAAFKINFYKEIDLLTEYSTVDKLISYIPSGYVDNSTSDDYIIEATVIKERTVTVDDEETIEPYTAKYTVNASKITGDGTMVVLSTYQDAETSTNSYIIKVSEDQVYN